MVALGQEENNFLLVDLVEAVVVIGIGVGILVYVGV